MDGIVTDINKVFGQEMAKIYAATIDRDEMVKTAQRVWDSFNSTSHTRYREYTVAQDIVHQAMIDALKGEVKKITDTEEFKTSISGMANSMVQEIVQKNS